MHHSILVVDMAGYGELNNRGQLQARAILNKSMNAAIRTIGLTQASLAIHHRGDGMLMVVPPTISKADLLDLLLPRLARTIHAANADPAGNRVRLRVAVHAGELIQDATGWFGTDLNLACRLVDAEAAYARLRASTESDVVLIVSDVIYQGVIRHGYYGLDPADYQRVRVRAKEVDATAWLRTWPTDNAPVPASPPLNERVGKPL
ncbi:hypothetical protein SAMN05421837_104395 [Amycolatopsis pretoriensis]|uniref:Guanylate cyclase domain-containing protein n=1 Tax=Amycolatopsis pretoriensis TaxID=218821 RepID=A0A1H5QS12_9PSEU|nr:hypothetical protein [Amycolatopsis pretoriensis]SEF28926.1 hypothetical protein SAMN05421837_104395 [Amycolatopsis pretoriensis]